MSEKPICPDCGARLEPHKVYDTTAECPDCDYEWDWVKAISGEYD